MSKDVAIIFLLASMTVFPEMPIEDATFRELPIVIAVLNVGAELKTTVPVIVPPPSSSLAVFKFVKFASTSLLVRDDPLPLRVTIVAMSNPP
tara:strand:- start:4773 stop:5048 length:276 start_codon:yes stop_codon:yes gene_type:complete